MKILFPKRFLAIDIGTRNIKLIVAKENMKNIILERAIEIATPKNSFYDGEIKDANTIKNSVEKAILDNKIKCKKTICTLQSTSIITREIILPFAKDKELKNMVLYQIEQYLPIMMDEYVIEYRILEELKEEEGKKLKLLVAAMPKKIAEGYFNLLKDMGLKPYALDINSNAISKAFNRELKINDENISLDKTVAVIDLGNTFTNITILENGIYKFSRIIEHGGRNIDLSIANSFDISIEEAEGKKIELGNLNGVKEDQLSYRILNELIVSSVEDGVDNIRRIFKFYTSRSTGNKIDAIYLYGGSSNIEGIEEFYSKMFNIPTFVIKKTNMIKFSKEIDEEKIPCYINAISSILRR